MPDETPEQCSLCSLYYDSANFCAKLTGNELLDLNAHSQTTIIKRGETVWDEIIERWPIFAIESGVMSLQHILRDGRKTIAAFFMRGDIIDLRNSSNRKAGHLIALSDVQVCRLSPKVFDRIIDSNPNARKLVWSNLRDQTFRAIDHSSDLAKKQAQEKLASFIFECSHRNPKEKLKDYVDIPIRRRDLAEYLGMQPETVSRCFKQIEKKGIIKVTDLSVIKILDVPALRQLANGGRDPSCGTYSPGAGYKILTSAG